MPSERIDEMRATLETTRTSRATLAAAVENVRIQLIRVGAGIGGPDDMREEVAILKTLVDSHDASVAAQSATSAPVGFPRNARA